MNGSLLEPHATHSPPWWLHALGIAALASAVAFSGAARQDWVLDVTIGAAALATAAGIWAATSRPARLDTAVLTRWAVVIAGVSMLEQPVRMLVGRRLGLPEAVVFVPVALVVLVAVGRAGSKPGPLGSVVPWLLGGLVVSVAALYISVEPEPQIDVLLANRAGAEALAAGENPYVSVVVPDTNPFVAEGATFDGYVYPPLALVLYSVSDWALGDPRWINALSVVMVVIGLGVIGRRGGVELAAAALVLPFLVKPAFGLIMRFGWTEPIALPFLLGAGLLWRRRPVASAVLLGLGFATKQYYILALPLLVLWSDEERWRRLGIVAAVVAATVLPFLVMDPVAYWNATVAPSLSAVSRPDSVGLAGLGIVLPTVVTVGIPLMVAVVAARRGSGGAGFLLALSATLAASFFVGFQAFENYWFLVYSLTGAAIVVAMSEADQDAGVAVSAAGS